ncbi:hypothetical protein [Streptomyces sp. PT12]|uniref:hypothetical protein n=1 Tax=Streptomyces sp. PT12 TaxID=1510197 RepID=UPI000DE54D94|nr:hypothetical protein [Streptomyces sp. PT12]RBM16065.1 hypothetical protein DEH69_17470 [Streptomyces sp. PT12]
MDHLKGQAAMSKTSHDHPKVGELVRDAAGRVGAYMGQAGPYAMLRPQGGGKEWQARRSDLRPFTPERCHA